MPAVSLALASILTKSVIHPDPTIMDRIRHWDTSYFPSTNFVTHSVEDEPIRPTLSNDNARPRKEFDTVNAELLGMMIRKRLRLILSQSGKTIAQKKDEKDDDEESKTSVTSVLSLHIDWDLLEKGGKGEKEPRVVQLEPHVNGDSISTSKLGNIGVLDESSNYDDWM